MDRELREGSEMTLCHVSGRDREKGQCQRPAGQKGHQCHRSCRRGPGAGGESSVSGLMRKMLMTDADKKEQTRGTEGVL